MAPQTESSTMVSSRSKTTQKRDDVATDTLDEVSAEEMPMDERIQDRRQEMMLCNVTEDMGDNLDQNLCGYTLNTMGQMCGVSPKNKVDRDPSAPKQIPQHAFKTGADEHTSIEVEYVEPRLRNPVSKAAAAAAAPPIPENTTKKSMLLSTITQKAREDYQKEVRTSPQEYSDDEYAQNTVYNTFSAPEKRKFIKLINIGISPTNAASQVLRERREGEAAAQETAEVPVVKKKASLFRTFMKNKPEEEEEEDPADVPAPEFSRSGINYYDAVRKSDAPDYTEPDEDDDDATSKQKKKKKSSLLPSFKKKRFLKVPGVEPKAGKQQAAASSPSQPRDNSAAVAGAAVVAGAAAAGGAVGVSRSMDSEDPANDDWMPPPPPSQEEPESHTGRNVAIAAGGATLGAAAMQSPFMTEEEVLRDLAMSDREAMEIREEKKIEDDMAAHLLAPMGGTPRGKDQVPVEITHDAHDVDDLETYLNSTEIVSSYGGGGVADHLTVVSNKSYRTSGTQGTNYTTSTRSRRPGQAQTRMEQQKIGEIQGRKARPSSHQMRGWQETMQQAAAENNRKWDPKLGWVDYEDPNAPRPVPTQELEGMPSPVMDHRGRGGVMPAAGDSTPVENPMPSVELEENQGWVESMKAASARLLAAGKKWDPKLGWVAVDGSEAKASRVDDGNVNTQSESDIADFTSDVGLPGEGNDEKLQIYEDEGSEVETQSRSKYVQLGATGAVQSFNKAGAASTKRSSLVVDVKKEKVDADDAEYFKNERRSGPVDLDEVGETPVSKSIPKLRGSKRDTSPVSRGIVTPEAKEAEGPGSVGKLSEMWESRSSTAGGGESSRKSSEWKAFLAKKQQAESEANRQRDGSFPENLSPIRKDNESEVASEASTAAMQPTTFMGRLQACAAPMIQRNGASPQGQGMRFIPPALCGRPDAIHEEDDTTIGTETTPRSQRSRSRSRPRSSKSDVSSVISDEMSGSKAAFLESMAMKAVVSSKKSKRRSTGSDAGTSSVVSTPRSSTGGTPVGSANADSKWQQFLEKKKGESGTGSVTGARSQASTSVSRAAEKYAAKKVEEMMETQRSRSESQGSGGGFKSRPMEEATGAFPKPAGSVVSSGVSTPGRLRTSLPFEPQKSEAQKAAEEAKEKRMSALRASMSPRGEEAAI